MSKPKTPPAPDYMAAAQAQGAANVDAARVSAKMSNPNIVNPYGSQTVAYGGEKVFDEAAYNKAVQDFNSGAFQTQQNFDAKKYLDEHPDVMNDKKYGGGDAKLAYQHYMDWGKPGGWEGHWKAPTKDMFTTDSDPDKVTVTQTLSPEQQKLFDQDIRISQGLGNLAEGGISRVDKLLGTEFDASKLPAMTGSVDPRTGEIRTNIDPTRTNIKSSVDSRFDQSGDQVQDALYRKQTSMLDPQYQQQAADMESRLANQGIMPGSEAYNREMDNFARQRDFAYGNARDSAILAGGDEQSRLFTLGLASANLNNTAQGQEFGQNATSAGFNNQGVAQKFNQGLASAEFGNQARQQAFQEQMALRQLPLNEINALRSGSQVTVPQFQGYSGQSVAAAPILQATQAQGQWDQGLYNAKSASASNNTTAGIGAAATMAAAFF